MKSSPLPFCLCRRRRSKLSGQSIRSDEASVLSSHIAALRCSRAPCGNAKCSPSIRGDIWVIDGDSGRGGSPDEIELQWLAFCCAVQVINISPKSKLAAYRSSYSINADLAVKNDTNATSLSSFLVFSFNMRALFTPQCFGSSVNKSQSWYSRKPFPEMQSYLQTLWMIQWTTKAFWDKFIYIIHGSCSIWKYTMKSVLTTL